MVADRGSDICLPSDESAAAAIRDATKGIAAMVVIAFVGIDATLVPLLTLKLIKGSVHND